MEVAILQRIARLYRYFHSFWSYKIKYHLNDLVKDMMDSDLKNEKENENEKTEEQPENKIENAIAEAGFETKLFNEKLTVNAVGFYRQEQNTFGFFFDAVAAFLIGFFVETVFDFEAGAFLIDSLKEPLT